MAEKCKNVKCVCVGVETSCRCFLNSNEHKSLSASFECRNVSFNAIVRLNNSCELVKALLILSREYMAEALVG